MTGPTDGALRAYERVVEAVAIALAEDDWSHVGGGIGDCLVPGTPNWKHKVRAARAAISAYERAMKEKS